MVGKETIMVVEDDGSIVQVLSTILRANNYNIVTAQSGKSALSLIVSYCPDLILLDLGLPDMDGLEVLSKVREWSSIPIIIVSARGHETEKVRALDCGADDYVTKPFGTSELLARIRTALRHNTAGDGFERPPASTYFVGKLLIDFNQYRVEVDGKDVHLTQIEFKIVALIARHAGQVLTYDFIIKNIWGPYADSNNRILRVNMANIRRKIEENPAEPRYILTEVGVGYRMIEE